MIVAVFHLADLFVLERNLRRLKDKLIFDFMARLAPDSESQKSEFVSLFYASMYSKIQPPPNSLQPSIHLLSLVSLCYYWVHVFLESLLASKNQVI